MKLKGRWSIEPLKNDPTKYQPIGEILFGAPDGREITITQLFDRLEKLEAFVEKYGPLIDALAEGHTMEIAMKDKKPKPTPTPTSGSYIEKGHGG